jgi:hypothetical protein
LRRCRLFRHENRRSRTSSSSETVGLAIRGYVPLARRRLRAGSDASRSKKRGWGKGEERTALALRAVRARREVEPVVLSPRVAGLMQSLRAGSPKQASWSPSTPPGVAPPPWRFPARKRKWPGVMRISLNNAVPSRRARRRVLRPWCLGGVSETAGGQAPLLVAGVGRRLLRFHFVSECLGACQWPCLRLPAAWCGRPATAVMPSGWGRPARPRNRAGQLRDDAAESGAIRPVEFA